jgi:hypothetical protein
MLEGKHRFLGLYVMDRVDGLGAIHISIFVRFTPKKTV